VGLVAEFVTSEIQESRMAVEALLMMKPLRRLPVGVPWM